MSKASLPEQEKQICRRVRVARELRGKTQQTCAELTGIQRSTLANYEAEVTPVAFDQAKRICYRLNINQWWFATGESPFAPYFDLSPNLEFSVKQNALFSEAFATVLKGPLTEQIEDLVSIIGVKAYFSGKYDDAVLNNLDLVGEEYGTASAHYLIKAIRLKLNWMPEQFLPEFSSALLEAEKRFWADHGENVKKAIKARRDRDAVAHRTLEGEKRNLTETASSEILSDVKPKLPSLLERLRNATNESGKMSALADYLHVPLASVSRWLSGKREPGGEITLRLLHWVEQQERQK